MVNLLNAARAKITAARNWYNTVPRAQKIQQIKAAGKTVAKRGAGVAGGGAAGVIGSGYLTWFLSGVNQGFDYVLGSLPVVGPVSPNALILAGTTAAGLYGGYRNWKAGVFAGSFGVASVAGAAMQVKKTPVITNTVHDTTIVHEADLEKLVGETNHIYPIANGSVFGELAHAFGYDVNETQVDLQNSSVQFLVDAQGQASLNGTIRYTSGLNITFDATKKLNPAQSRDAFAVAHGMTNQRDAYVVFEPSVDLNNIMIERALAADEIAALGKLGVNASAGKVSVTFDPQTRQAVYKVGDEVVGKDAAVKIFNFAEDGNLNVNYFEQNVLKPFENSLSFYAQHLEGLDARLSAQYHAGVLSGMQEAGPANRSAGMDLANITNDNELRTYLNATWGVSNDTLRNMSRQEMWGLVALSAGNNAAGQIDIYKWAREEAKAKAPSHNWSAVADKDLLSTFYGITFGEGAAQGASDTTGLLVDIMNLSPQEVAGNYTLQHLVDVYTAKKEADAFNHGYESGLQDMRLTEWMNSVNATYLSGLNASARNDTIKTWVANADSHPSKGWQHTELSDRLNQSVLMSIYNDANITNATKAYIRAAVNSGDKVLLLNTTENTSFAQRYTQGRVSDDGFAIGDADFNRVLAYVRGGN